MPVQENESYYQFQTIIHLNISEFIHSSIQAFSHSSIYSFKHSDIQTFRHLRIYSLCIQINPTDSFSIR